MGTLYPTPQVMISRGGATASQQNSSSSSRVGRCDSKPAEQQQGRTSPRVVVVVRGLLCSTFYRLLCEAGSVPQLPSFPPPSPMSTHFVRPACTLHTSTRTIHPNQHRCSSSACRSWSVHARSSWQHTQQSGESLEVVGQGVTEEGGGRSCWSRGHAIAIPAEHMNMHRAHEHARLPFTHLLPAHYRPTHPSTPHPTTTSCCLPCSNTHATSTPHPPHPPAHTTHNYHIHTQAS